MYKTIGIISLSAMVLTSCGVNNEIIQTPSKNTSALLESTQWQNWDFQLDFQNQRYLAHAGCNSISWSYNLSEDGTLTMSDGMSTLMLCDDETMQKENELQYFLSNVESIQHNDDSLTLSSWEKTMEFTPAEATSLFDTKWKLSGMLSNQAIVMDISFQDSFVEFSKEWKISGQAMCNNFMWNFTQNENNVAIQALGSTKMLCPNEDANTYESQLLSDLQSVNTYEISRDTLTLTNSDNSVKLIFSAK